MSMLPTAEVRDTNGQISGARTDELSHDVLTMSCSKGEDSRQLVT